MNAENWLRTFPKEARFRVKLTEHLGWNEDGTPKGAVVMDGRDVRPDDGLRALPPEGGLRVEGDATSEEHDPNNAVVDTRAASIPYIDALLPTDDEIRERVLARMDKRMVVDWMRSAGLLHRFQTAGRDVVNKRKFCEYLNLLIGGEDGQAQ